MKLNIINTIHIYDPKTANIINKINDKSLHFIHHHKVKEKINTYLISKITNLLTKKQLTIFRKVSVYETDENDNFISIKVSFKKIENKSNKNIIQFGIISENIKDDITFFKNLNILLISVTSGVLKDVTSNDVILSSP
mgnify:CR=1 FL=1